MLASVITVTPSDLTRDDEPVRIYCRDRRPASRPAVLMLEAHKFRFGSGAAAGLTRDRRPFEPQKETSGQDVADRAETDVAGR